METTKIELTVGGTTKRSRFEPLPVTIDWNALPDNSQRFVIEYGLKQFLADAMAGAGSQAEAHDSAKARIAKLESGDLSRTRGEPKDKPDTVESRALKLATAFIRDQLKAANVKAEAAAIKEAAAELVRDEPKWKSEAKKQLDAEMKLKEQPDDRASSVIAALLAKVKGADADEGDESDVDESEGE